VGGISFLELPNSILTTPENLLELERVKIVLGYGMRQRYLYLIA